VAGVECVAAVAAAAGHGLDDYVKPFIVAGGVVCCGWTPKAIETKGLPMRRTPNYRFERSEREKKKHRKKIEKLGLQAERTARRQAMKDSAGDASATAAAEDTPRRDPADQ
jgi:hypothetical protein